MIFQVNQSDELRKYQTDPVSTAALKIGLVSLIFSTFYVIYLGLNCYPEGGKTRCRNAVAVRGEALDQDFATYLGAFIAVGLALFVLVLGEQLKGTVDEQYNHRRIIGAISSSLIAVMSPPTLILILSWWNSGKGVKIFVLLPLYIVLFAGAVFLGRFNLAHPKSRFENSIKEYEAQIKLIGQRNEISFVRVGWVILCLGGLWFVCVSTIVFADAGFDQFGRKLMYSALLSVVFMVLSAGICATRVQSITGAGVDRWSSRFLLVYGYIIIFSLFVPAFRDLPWLWKIVSGLTILFPLVFSMKTGQSMKSRNKYFSFLRWVDAPSAVDGEIRRKFMQDLCIISAGLARATIDYYKLVGSSKSEASKESERVSDENPDEAGERRLIWVEGEIARMFRKPDLNTPQEQIWEESRTGEISSFSTDRIEFIEDIAVVIEERST